VNQQKPYAVVSTPLIQAALAEAVARDLPVPRGLALTPSDVRPVLNTLTADQVGQFVEAKFKSLTGFTPPLPDKLRDFIKQRNTLALQVGVQSPRALELTPIQVPTKDLAVFNWTQKGFAATNSGIVTAVQNQNPCGCCWAFATVGAYEAAYAKKHGVLIGASEQYLLDCTKGVNPDSAGGQQSWDCFGGWWAFDLLWAQKVNFPGLPRRVDLPYAATPQVCPSNIDKPFEVANWGFVDSTGQDIPTDPDLKDALCKYGPLAIAIKADSAWMGNQGAVLSDFPNDLSQGLNHAVVLIGWDNNRGAWLIKNSWGPTCGIVVNGANTGFMYVKYGSNNIGYSAAWVVAK
jgi:cathepsin L